MGKVIGSRIIDSTVYPGKRRTAYKVHYAVDGTHQEFEEEEIRPVILVNNLPERKAILDGLLPAFRYLEDRITGAVEVSSYSCVQMYQVCL